MNDEINYDETTGAWSLSLTNVRGDELGYDFFRQEMSSVLDNEGGQQAFSGDVSTQQDYAFEQAMEAAGVSGDPIPGSMERYFDIKIEGDAESFEVDVKPKD